MTSEDRYAEEFGAERLAAQKALAKTFHSCCAEPKDGPHHRVCRRYVDDDAPVVVLGQIDLITDAL